MLSLIGDVAEGQDGPILHAHVVLGLSDGTTRGGHLLEGLVFPTLEVVVTETPAELRKVMRPDLGIALIDLDRSESQPDGEVLLKSLISLERPLCGHHPRTMCSSDSPNAQAEGERPSDNSRMVATFRASCFGPVCSRIIV